MKQQSGLLAPKATDPFLEQLDLLLLRRHRLALQDAFKDAFKDTPREFEEST